MVKILPKKFDEEYDAFLNVANDIKYQTEMISRGLLDPARYFGLKRPEFIGQNMSLYDRIFEKDSTSELISKIEKITSDIDRIAPKTIPKNLVLSFK